MSFYIGVDGGGTKTAFSLFDEDKNVVKTVYGPGSNHENLEGAFDEASAVIWNGITELVGEAGISLDDVAFSLMGLAGIDHQSSMISCARSFRKRGFGTLLSITTALSSFRRAPRAARQ